MRRVVLAAVALALAGCPHRSAGTKPPPQLAPVQTLPLNVVFLGTPPNQTELYVCGWTAGEFSCVEYVFFQTQIQEQQ